MKSRRSSTTGIRSARLAASRTPIWKQPSIWKLRDNNVAFVGFQTTTRRKGAERTLTLGDKTLLAKNDRHRTRPTFTQEVPLPDGPRKRNSARP